MAAAIPKYMFEERVIDDLIDLLRYGPKLEDIVKSATSTSVGSSFSGIVRHVSAELSLSEDDAERVLMTLQNICRMQGRMRVDDEEMVGMMLRNVEDYAKSKKESELLTSLNAIKPILIEIIKSIGPDHPLTLARKAERVYYAHQNLFSEVRIITDLRPIFDKAGEKVVKMIVSHSLVIDYFEGNQSHRIELGIDATDVSEIRRACDRAQVKAVALRDALKDNPWPTTFGMEDSDK